MLTDAPSDYSFFRDMKPVDPIPTNKISKLHSTRTTATADITISDSADGAELRTAKSTSDHNIMSKERRMKRRNALISRTSSPIQIEDGSTSQRSVQRRNATCGSPNTVRNVQAATFNNDDNSSPTRTDILFDEADRPCKNHEGNHAFKIRLHFTFVEMYQFAPDETQMSVITLSILDELKSANVRFYSKVPVNNRLQFRLMSDTKAVGLIKQEFENMRHCEKRSRAARSA